MALTFAAILVLIALAAFVLQFAARVRQLTVAPVDVAALPAADRYRPMLRLLSDDDCAVIGADKALTKKFRQRRIQLFRQYLRCLTKDYGRLLAGVRFAMVNSGIDRPDLAKVLVINKLNFVMALCRIEFALRLHQAGFAKVDVSGLVEAMELLRAQITFMSPVGMSSAMTTAAA